MSDSVAFFDRQFRAQLGRGERSLNPFEQAVLPHLRGRVLELGCGLGNLALAAARRGCIVTALDGSATAIEHLAQVAEAEALPLQARCVELAGFDLDDRFDSVAAIGLLMFFDCASAQRMLARIRAWVAPGGVAAVNLLVQGTSYLEMFGGDAYCLLGEADLAGCFAGWEILLDEGSRFAAPGGTEKVFRTVVARRGGTEA